MPLLNFSTSMPTTKAYAAVWRSHLDCAGKTGAGGEEGGGAGDGDHGREGHGDNERVSDLGKAEQHQHGQAAGLQHAAEDNLSYKEVMGVHKLEPPLRKIRAVSILHRTTLVGPVRNSSP